MESILVIAREEWVIVGEKSSDTLLVRGGKRPVAIRVSSSDAGALRELVVAANRGLTQASSS
jgi:hypothetical protein